MPDFDLALAEKAARYDRLRNRNKSPALFHIHELANVYGCEMDRVVDELIAKDAAASNSDFYSDFLPPDTLMSPEA